MTSLELLVTDRFGRIKEGVERAEQEMKAKAAWVRGLFTNRVVADVEAAEVQVEGIFSGETKRNRRMTEVAGVARGWLQVLEQKGIKTEDLPERWNLENQQMHMAQPGVEFKLFGDDGSGGGGKVEIGRWNEKRFVEGREVEGRGISMKITCGPGSKEEKESGDEWQERIWLIDLDHFGRVTYFSDNYLADGEEGRLGKMKFTGETQADWERWLVRALNTYVTEGPVR